MSTQQAYPLSWPVSWPRFKGFRTSSRFERKSMERAATETYAELKRLGCSDWNVVISTNVALRRDGIPYSNAGRPSDPGVAVYFKIKGKDRVLACDKWATVEENLWSIAKHIEAIRAQDRYGVGSIDQAFAGYTALPAPGESAAATWYQVLGVAHDAPFDVARDAYLKEAKLCHPDVNGGSNEPMQRLNAAWDQARKAYGK